MAADETPDPVRAHARFRWSAPGRTEGETYAMSATLYASGRVELSVPPALDGIVDMLEWSTEDDCIRQGSGTHVTKEGWTDAMRDHLKLKASNALRKALGLGSHPATTRYPDTEV